MSHPGSRARPPVAVDVHGQQMIEQIVTGRDAAEHTAHPTGRLLFALGSRRRGSAHGHSSDSFIAARTWRSATSGVIVTTPISTGSTKCTRPFTVFLSLLSRANSRSAFNSRQLGKGPYRQMHSAMEAVHSSEQVPSIRPKMAAVFMPQPTASPCRNCE